MNKNTVYMILSLTASAAAGALATASIKDARISALKTEVRNLKFKQRLMKRATDAMQDEIPDDRVGAVNDRIDTDFKFEQITSLY
jgi:hypothetical protein